MTNFAESINISVMGFIAIEKLERFSRNVFLLCGTTLFHTNLPNCYKTVQTALKTHILTSMISELTILVTSSLFFVSGVNLVSQLRFLGLTKSHDKVVQGCVPNKAYVNRLSCFH